MQPVVGVFATRQEAEEATERLSERGLGQVTLLTPDDWKEKVRSVRTEDMEQPGIGAALCVVWWAPDWVPPPAWFLEL